MAMNQNFDHIVSLGGNCETKYQIRRLFPDAENYIFDWFVTPTSSMVDMIENDFSDMFLEKNMRVIFDGDGVACDRYGTVHFHNFPHAHPEGKYVQELVTAGCAMNQEKFKYLAHRFRSLKGRVLFIRLEDGFVTGGDRNGDFTDELYDRFTAAIEKMMPEADYQVLLLRGAYRADRQRLHIDVAEKYDETSWEGSVRGWDELIQRQQIGHSALSFS